MEQFTYKDKWTLQIHCPVLNNEEAFVIAIDNACAGIKSYSGSNIDFVNQQGEPIRFWKILLEKTERYPLAVKYLQACINQLKECSYLAENDRFLASFLAYQLAMKDKCFLPYYAELLGLWDMDHETEEKRWIEKIANHHGWCKGIEDIIIARSTIPGCGQHGIEQLCEFANFIRKHNEPLVESPFFIRLVKAIIKDDIRIRSRYGENTWNGVYSEYELESVFGENASEAATVSKMLAENMETILAKEREIINAIKKNNIEKMNELIHEDLVFNIPNGKVITKKMDMEEYRSGNTKIETIESSEQTIRFIGDNALVSVKVKMSGTFMKQNFDGDFSVLRIWKKFDQEWQIIAGSSTQIYKNL